MTTTQAVHPSAVSALLRNLPDELETAGWCQQKDIDNVGAMCFRGAIAKLAHGDPAIHTGALFDATMRACSTHLGAGVVDWNDTPGRTLAEVSAACIATAEEVDAETLTLEQLAAASIVCVTQLQVDQVVTAGKLVVINAKWRGSSSAVLRDFSSAELWDFSSAELRDSSSAELRDSSSAMLRDSSSAVLRDFSSAVLRDFSSAVLRDFSSAELRDFSSAELWDSSSAVLWGSSSAMLRDSSSAVLRDFSSAVLWDFSSAELRDSSSAELWDSSSAELRSIAAVGIWRRYESGLWPPQVVVGSDDIAANGAATLRLVDGTVQAVAR